MAYEPQGIGGRVESRSRMPTMKTEEEGWVDTLGKTVAPVRDYVTTHPIRLALTGEPQGLELDLAVPLIERGAVVTAADWSGIRRIPSASLAFR